MRTALALYTLVFTAVGAAAVRTAQAQLVLHEFASPDEVQNGNFGFAVAGVPDADGDGHGDVLVGAPSEGLSPDGAGAAYLFSGASGDLLLQLRSPNEEEDGNFGFAVAGVPDADGDGRGDLLVGAHWEDPGASPDQAGRVYLFSGASGDLLFELASPNEEVFGFFGFAVAGVPDADGDGRGDLLVGARSEDPGVSPNAAGRAYLFSGATGDPLYTLASPNEEDGGVFGHAVAGVPDADGDGRGDLLVAARNEGPDPGFPEAGRAYLFSGASGALLYTLASPNQQPFGLFGNAVAGVPDLDGDGHGDLLVGAYEEAPGPDLDDAGRAYAFSGATGAPLHELVSPTPRLSGSFGASVAGTDDVDGDGRGDLLVGAPHESRHGGFGDAGQAHLFSGASGAPLYTLSSPRYQSRAEFGVSVAGVPDADGDGRGDLAVGARTESAGGSPPGAGHAYLFTGERTDGLSVAARPVDPPVVIPPSGGSFAYVVTITNATAATQPFDAWAMATLPNGSPFGPVVGPQRVRLPAGATVSRTLQANVPARAPAGTYALAVNVGTYPSTVFASDAFTFVKQGSSGPSPVGMPPVGMPPVGMPPVMHGGGSLAFDDAAAPAVAARGAATPRAPIPLDLAVTPNPTRGRTALTFALPSAQHVRLALYDVLGREVALLADGLMAAGPHAAALDASALPAGVYVWRIVADGEAQAGRLTVVR